MATPQIFPAGPDPLTLDAGRASRFTSFTETLGPSPDGSPGEGMVVTVARSGPAGPAGAGAPDPRFRVRAAGGEPVDVQRFPQGTEVHDADGNPLGEVDFRPPAGGVYEIELFVSRAGSTWELEITNTDSVPRTFTWVAAAARADARRPWIVVQPAQVPLRAEAGGAAVAGSVTVENHGTGPLRVEVADPPGPELTATLDGRPAPATGTIAPGGAGQIGFAFVPPPEGLAVEGTVTTRYVVDCDDAVAAHPHRAVDLVVTTTLPPPRDVEVAFVAVLPPNGEAFRQRIRENDDNSLAVAMNVVCAAPLRLGTAVYPAAGGAPRDPGALRAIADALATGVQGEFPDVPFYTRATWLQPAGGPGAAVDTLLAQRRAGLAAALGAPERGGLDDPGPAAATMPTNAFDIARRTGIPQPAIMVVEVVLAPVIDSSDHSGERWTVTGRNFQLGPGDSVFVELEWDVDAQFGESIDADPVVVDEVTATSLRFTQPRITLSGVGRDHIDADLFIQRPDGAENQEPGEFGIGLM
jgi:hypothetical protein